MKKVLIASTALVAATMLSAGTASASEKIKLNLGGFSKWFVVGAWQDDNYQAGDNSATATGQKDYNNVDVKADNEIFFGGSTTLDNGLKVGVDVQLEAGGNHQGSDSADLIDESYIWIEGGFGKFIIGSENNGTYLLHVNAPDAAGNWNEGGMLTGNFGGNNSSVIVNPGVSGLGGGNTTAIATDGDAEKITYVAPSFYGLTVGASYVPNSKEDDRGPTQIANGAGTGVTTGEIYGAAALYANTFGGVGVKASAGWVTYSVEDANGATAGNGAGAAAFLPGKTGVNEYAFGGQLSYAGFTVGGSYRKVAADAAVDALDGNGWDAGIQYASGPYAVSFAYFKSKVEGAATPGDDEIEIYQASGKYALGPGVDVLATVGHAKFEDEAGAGVANNGKNEGWAVMTGLSLAF
ncbi:MAG: porin [Magnetospirillum sp.]|nr:porin [Magnetospirillum sp.]